MNVTFRCTQAVIHDRYNLSRGDTVQMPKGVAETLKAFGTYTEPGAEPSADGDANDQSGQTEGQPEGSAQGDGEKPSSDGSDTPEQGVKMASEPENKMIPDAEGENKAEAPAPAPAPAGKKKR